MDRRDFLKLAGITGLAVGGPCPGASVLRGVRLAGANQRTPAPAIAGPTGLLFFVIQATGGWEPTMLCDPHPDLNGLYTDAVDVNTVNGVSYPVFPGGGPTAPDQWNLLLRRWHRPEQRPHLSGQRWTNDRVQRR